MADEDDHAGSPQLESREPTLADLCGLCRELNRRGARYVVVGGFAIAALGYNRRTIDVDLLIDTSGDNESRVLDAVATLPDGAARQAIPFASAELVWRMKKPTHRAKDIPDLAYVSSATPAPNSTTAPFDSPINVDLTGAGIVLTSVRLSVDGQLVNATTNQTGDLTTIRYQPPTRLPPKSQHAVSIAFNDGQDRTISYNFTAADYAVLNAALKVTADTTKPGFLWNVHHNLNLAAINDNIRPQRQLSPARGSTGSQYRRSRRARSRHRTRGHQCES